MFLVFISLFFILLFGCSNTTHDPSESLDSYISYWEKEDFSKMYQMLTTDTKEEFGQADFTEQYEKIYNDLEITNISITYPAFSDDDLAKMKDEKETKQTVTVKMESLAGPIAFEREIAMEYVVVDEDEDISEWFFNWDEGFIFPELAEGGSIKVYTDKPRRGEILDRNRMPLAINDLAYEVGVIPGQIFDDNELHRIAQLIRMSVDSINTKLDASWVEEHHYVPLNVISSHEEGVINELRDFPSVKLVETTGRVYPSENAAAHITGYVGKITAEELEKYPDGPYRESDMIGKNGLELMLEDRLRGSDGKRIVIEKEGADDVILAEQPVQNGEHIQLTIDINVQERIFDVYDNLSGTAAAIDPKSGEVKALVSSPAFDPNDFVYGISEGNWNALMDHPDKPLVNRFTSTYAPGSVIKPVTAAIGLKNGAITHDDTVEINGLKWKKDNWKDYQITRVSTTTGPVNLKTAMLKSDNIFFAMKAVDMTDKQFTDGLVDFGFTDKIPLDFTFQLSQISNSNDLKDEVLRANTGYGQGEIEVSSLHMALMYTPFLNKGNMVKPTLLLDEKTGEFWKKDLMNEADAEKMQSYLRDVVKNGTAKSALDDDLAISGKTGTAELKLALGTTGHQNGWFVGYPTDEQDILIAMMVEKSENIGTSSFVAEQVKNIFLDLE